MSEEEQVVSMQRTDLQLKSIMAILSQEKSGRTPSDIEIAKDYHLRNGLLYKKVKLNSAQKKL